MKLQWGQCLSTLETRVGCRTLRLLWPCFNGASVFQHWKPDVVTGMNKEALVASMGPVSFNTGNHCSEGRGSRPIQCFNGASVFQHWKRGYRAGDKMTELASMGPVSFNTGNRPGFSLTFGCCLLQWGQCLSTLETTTKFDSEAALNRLQWGQCLSTLETRKSTLMKPTPARFNGASVFQHWKLWFVLLVSRFGLRFNGASVFQHWKLRTQAPEPNDSPASMGPVSFNTGNLLSVTVSFWMFPLQWGQCLSTLETKSPMGHH